MSKLEIGDTFEVTGVVTRENTAESLGSGALPVFGTPYLAAMMENAAYTLMQRSLPEGRTSVGTRLDISHVSPSPIGMRVRAAARVAAISENGKIVDFEVKAYDEAGLIGEGTHQRAVVNIERFMSKCSGKLE